jgi:hypothetical protein
LKQNFKGGGEPSGMEEATPEVADSAAIWRLPDELIAKIMSTLAREEPSSFFKAACACKHLHRVPILHPELWKEEFYGPVQPTQDNCEAKALVEAVERFGGYQRLVRAHWETRALSNGPRSEQVDRPEAESVSECPAASFLFMLRDLKGRLFMWSISDNTTGNLKDAAWAGMDSWLPAKKKQVIGAVLRPLVFQSYKENEFARECEQYMGRDATVPEHKRPAMLAEIYALNHGSERLAPLFSHSNELMCLRDRSECGRLITVRSLMFHSSMDYHHLGRRHNENLRIITRISIQDGAKGLIASNRSRDFEGGVAKGSTSLSSVLGKWRRAVGARCFVYPKSRTLNDSRWMTTPEVHKWWFKRLRWK